MNKLIAVTIGDINGVGIELLIKSWKNKKIDNFVLFCDYKVLAKYLKQNKLKVLVNIYNDEYIYRKKFLNIFSYNSKNLPHNTLLSINYAYNECKNKKFFGMITLPLRKDLIIKNLNSNFIGHTEYLQKLDKKDTSNMILVHKKLIISTLTTHISLKNIVKTIKKKNYIYKKIIALDETLKKDFGLNKPKILISGINPHSGENGLLGTEENIILKPAINKLKRKGILIHGPESPDSILIKSNINKYDCFLFIYHDQALIPYKFISNFEGLNFTGNLDILRISPDHGTAYNLVGKNKANPSSLIKCFNILSYIIKNRKKYEIKKKITRAKLSSR